MEERERQAAPVGWELVELQQVASEGRPAAAEQRIDGLQTRLQGLQRELDQVRSQLAGVEQQAQAAIEAENADRAAETWQQKRALQERLSGLEREHREVQLQLSSEMQTVLAGLQTEGAALASRRLNHGEALRQLVASVEEALERLRHIQEDWEGLRGEQEAWNARLEALAHRQLTLLTERHGEPLLTQPGGRRPPGLEARTAAARAPGGTAKKWAVYDPDSGKLVENLAELRRLLLRWYPNVRDEGQRVQQFLRLPNAAPLPESLRRELQEAGYLN